MEMKNNKGIKVIIWLLLFSILCAGGYILYDRGRPSPVPMKKTLYEGVVYHRIVKVIPHPMIAHVIKIDKNIGGIQFLVTPADFDGDMPLNARTTSQFLSEFGVQIAINGDGFAPWWSRSLIDYYPHVGDPVTPLGFTASEGNVYALGGANKVGTEPTFFVSRRKELSFNIRPDKPWFAISGDRMLISRGEVEEGLDNVEREPRTAIGINRNGRYLFLVVIDGRQPLYSEGATYSELADFMFEQGAYYAMIMDGGGSSTMVIEGENGKPVILNSPIDNYIPGRERPVANHFGIYINP